jgi:hypothetical protein
MGSDSTQKYWYNTRTNEVEYGMLSASVYRVGPFDTRDQAQAAPALLRARSEAWSREEEEND